MEKPCRVFCCYAREDQKFLRDLRKHLMPLERSGLVTVQTDADVDPGEEWRQEIDHYLDTADIILLLISPSFMTSDYCFNESQKAITRHKQERARVIPIIIRPTNWQSSPLGELQCLPKDGKPVSTAQNTDTILLTITEEIRMLVQKLSTTIHTEQEKEKPLMSPRQEDPSSANSRDQYNNNASKFNFRGPVHSNVIGDNTHIDTINNTYGGKDGICSLEKGSKALWNKDYKVAKKELRTAVEEIDQEEQTEEAAKARYFQALAILGDELPRHKGVVERENIDKLLQASINLDPLCKTYIIAIATIVTDLFESNALPERQQNAYKWQAKANSTAATVHDEELLPYLARCQPNLYQQTWWKK